MRSGPCPGWLRLLLFMCCLQTGWGIMCLQCTTLRDKGCESGSIPPTECSPSDKFCLKYIGRVNAGSVVFRGCNKRAIQHLCAVKAIEGQNVRVCYETCNTTACNGGPVTNSAHALRSVTSLIGSLLTAAITVAVPSIVLRKKPDPFQ